MKQVGEDTEEVTQGNAPMTEEDKEKTPIERPSGTRWWEQYTVRYFVGTVIGLVVIAALKSDGQLKWTSLIPELGLTDPKKLAVFAAMGLAFCYVASAPILTLHAVRGAYRLDRAGYLAVLMVLLASPFAMSYIAAKFSSSVAGWTALLVIVGLQFILIAIATLNEFDSTKKFYDRLVVARYNDWKSKKDYVDSYRHLREHGNALGIVLLELALGSILSTLKFRNDALAAVIFWIIPGAWCWVIGNVLESHFANRSAA